MSYEKNPALKLLVQSRCCGEGLLPTDCYHSAPLYRGLADD
jgi:hypothetical protein